MYFILTPSFLYRPFARRGFLSSFYPLDLVRMNLCIDLQGFASGIFTVVLAAIVARVAVE